MYRLFQDLLNRKLKGGQNITKVGETDIRPENGKNHLRFTQGRNLDNVNDNEDGPIRIRSVSNRGLLFITKEEE